MLSDNTQKMFQAVIDRASNQKNENLEVQALTLLETQPEEI
tara:strand:- start:2172 stop:2294 length:123 start_codon:yes stop_codon:yes gene_type:complete